MTTYRTRRAFLASGATATAVGLVGCTGGDNDDTTLAANPTGSSLADSMTIFHAGSLAPPFSAAEPDFENRFDVDVTREAKGSVASTQKITQQRRSADVLGTSDFRLIRNRVLPDYGDWYAIFTTNSMSIQYRENSPGAEDISKDNWWEVLSRDDITIGHSDPAIDPGGYRAVMMLQLGAEEFDGERLYDESTLDTLMSNTTIPTGTEINLEWQLESGDLDYVLYYQSISATSGLPYIDLQPEVDLSQVTNEYAQHYAKAEVETKSGTFTGAPIAYGLTVPSNARAPGRGTQWVKHFATEPGQAILDEQGLAPVDPVVVPASSEDAVPDSVMDVASAQSTLGPLEP